MGDMKKDALIPKDAVFKYSSKLRTRWVDTDAQLVLNNAVFLTLMEEARVDYFGKNNLNLLPEDMIVPFLMLKTEIRFLKPGKGATNVLVDIRTIHLGVSSFTQQYRIRNAENGDVWCEAQTVLVYFDFKNKSKMQMPDTFRKRIEEFENFPITNNNNSSIVAAQQRESIIETNYHQNPLQVGHYAQMRKRFGPEEVNRFAELSEDYNPLHLDENFARTTRFGRPIVHGQLYTSLISALAGTKLPGKGSIYMSQNSRFLAPVFVGDEVTARVQVKSIDTSKNIVIIETICKNAEGKLVMTGEATLMVPAFKLSNSNAPLSKL
jgi:enoyl-CoA hydratase